MKPDTMFFLLSDRPQAVIVTDPPASVMFTGETVSLACDIRKGSGWRYSWSRNTQGRLEGLYARSTESQQKHILHSVRESDSGEYLCQVERGQNPVIQSFPGTLVLNVSGEKPMPVITQNAPSGEIYTGERVTLSCGFGGDPAGWKYLWYKDTQRHTVPNTDSSRTDGSSFTISSAALAHSGEYRCIAARGREPFYSDYSDPLTLEISALPQAQLTVQSGWADVFPTETVTLRCVIQSNSTEWMYKWYRDGRELPVDKADSNSSSAT
ncbi:Fc receptor-like protein 3 [Anguilla rostrata]|uniref:Fc receptor-like protein 3 n=1 Tax=Anguilla rostrata TaxID=7938 RepID=UPI0030CDB55A